MKNVAVGSFVTLILFTGLLVSQVEAKNDDNGYKGKNKQEYKFNAKNNKFDAKHDNRFEFKNHKYNDTRSVPIPGTLLLLGGGFAGLVAWRARQRKPRA